MSSKVTIIELMDQIAPAADAETIRILQSALADQGMIFHTSAKVAKVSPTKAALMEYLQRGGPDGGVHH